MLVMIRAIVRPEKADAILAALMDAGFPAVTKYSVAGRGKQRGIKIGEVTYDEIPKTMLMSVVKEEDTDFVIKTIMGTARSGSKAGVFANRLRDGMRLQSDPTVTYGIEDFSGPITKIQLKTITPYNTYLIDGLPKGPICSPGRSALLAVLKPEDHKYLYFVSQNDGTHYFSTSLQEHNLAVQKYQRKKTDKESK